MFTREQILALLDSDVAASTDPELGVLTEAISAALSDRGSYTRDELSRLVEVGRAVSTERDTRVALTAELDGLAVALTDPTPEPVVEPAVTTPDPVPVAASAGTVSQLAGHRNQPLPPNDELPPAAVIVAAGGSPGGGRTDGTPISNVVELGSRMESAWRGTSPPANGAVFNRAAQKQWDAAHRFTQDSGESNYRTLRTVYEQAQAAARDSVYKGSGVTRTLQAASGICGPSEARYDFLSLTSTDGLIDLPEVGLTRGSVQIPQSTTYQDLRLEAGVGQSYTSANGVAGTTKSTFTVACPGVTTFNLTGWATILRFSNFQGQFFPEYVADTTQTALAAHAQKVNNGLLDAIIADANTLTYSTSDKGGGAFTQFIRQVTFHVWLYRDKYRLARDTILDVVFPYRALGAIIADVAARDSTTTAGLMVASAISQLETEIGARIQFVYGLMEMLDAPGDFGDEVYDALVYPAGAVIRITGETLDLGVVRDSTRNAANEFETFTETFDAVATTGYEIMRLTDMVLCPNGETGSRVTITCTSGASGS